MKLKLAFCLFIGLGMFNCKPVEQNPCEQKLVHKIFAAVQDQHLNKKPLNDELSQAFFIQFLSIIDANKEFFTQKDLTELRLWENQLEELFANGQLDFFDRALVLLDGGIGKAEGYCLLALDGNIDFSRKEKLAIKEKQLTFAKDDQALADRWRKKIKYQLLNELWIRGKTATDWSDPALRKAIVAQVKQNNEKKIQTLKRVSRAERLDTYVNAFLSIHDYQSEYLSPEKKAKWRANFTREFVGLGLTFVVENDYPEVIAITIGGPAWKSKSIDEGDIILSVAEEGKAAVEMAGKNSEEVSKILKGTKGTLVELKIKKADNAIQKINIRREQVLMEMANSLVLRQASKSKRMGYLRLPRFYAGEEGCASHILQELRKLQEQKVNGIVLDLRNNKGGSSVETNQIMGYFLETGPLMQVERTSGSISLMEDEDPSVAYDGPLVVLVNGRSGSASELLSGTLQDYQRAVIVGSPSTFGKGSMQRFVELEEEDSEEPCQLGEVKMSIARFFTASGRSPQYTGIVPDIILPDEYAYVSFGERKEKYALPPKNLSLKTVSQEVYKVGDLKNIKAASAQRVAQNISFQLADQYAKFLKAQEEKTTVDLSYPDFVAAKEAERKAKKIYQQVYTSMTAFQVFSTQKNTETIDSAHLEKEERLRARILKDPYVEECFRILEELDA